MANLLPLYTFFEILGFNPFHAFGVAGTTVPADSGCDTLVRRYEWQNSDAVGHKAIEEAITHAEARLAEYLGFSVAPHYVTETVNWPTRDDGLLRSGPFGSDGRWLTVQLGEGYVRAVGVESLTLIATANITYSDSDGDTIDDTFTVSAATSVTDASEIAAYFSAGDRFNGWGSTTAVGDRWRVQPVQVTISGGTVTIRGSKVLCVKPIKYEGVANIGANGLEPTTAANFATTLDIYRRFTDATGTTAATAQAVITWETRPSHGWWCCCDSCTAPATAFSGSPFDPAATAQAVARVAIRDAIHGIVAPAEAAYDSTTQIFSSLSWTVCDQPDRVTIRYLAGFPLGSDGQMQEPYRTIVARMAAAELTRPVCGCDSANRELYRWQFELSQTARGDELFSISPEDLNNPFGTRRGQVYAWKMVRRLMQQQGILG
jgi:hypothetical protein